MDVIHLLTHINQHHHKDLGRQPNKTLLILLALSQLAATGSSRLVWTEVESVLNRLLEEFGNRADVRSAAYPFTRLVGDGFWKLNQPFSVDASPRKLRDLGAEGELDGRMTKWLLRSRSNLMRAVRAVVEREFPETLVSEVLVATGFDPYEVLAAEYVRPPDEPRRDPSWAREILALWENQCAFCSFDGRFHGKPVALDAAHVQWFKLGGPDSTDNGLALCVLHHRLLDRGAIGFSSTRQLKLSPRLMVSTSTNYQVDFLDGYELRPPSGCPLPRQEFVEWHDRNVFR